MDKKERIQRFEQMRANIIKDDSIEENKTIHNNKKIKSGSSTEKRHYSGKKNTKNKIKKLATALVIGTVGIGLITGISNLSSCASTRETIESVNENYKDLLEKSLEDKNEKDLQDLLATIQEYKEIGMFGNRELQASKIKNYSGLIETVTMNAIKGKIAEALGIKIKNIEIGVHDDQNNGPLTQVKAMINGQENDFVEKGFLQLFEKNVYPTEISSAIIDVSKVQKYNNGKNKDLSVDDLIGIMDLSKSIALNKYEYKDDKIVKVGRVEQTEKTKQTEEVEETEKSR